MATYDRIKLKTSSKMDLHMLWGVLGAGGGGGGKLYPFRVVWGVLGWFGVFQWTASNFYI